MRAVAVLGTMLLAAACQDPTVDVAITVPDAPRAYRDEIATMTVRVLAPTDAEVDCDYVAFGHLDDDAIELAQVTAVTLRDGASAIDGVPRLGRKLFLAEGRDRRGDAVVAGCAELRDVDADVTVAIATEPTVVLTVDGPAPDEPVPSAAVTVHVDDGFTDPAPAPIGGRELRWDVYGAADEHLEGPRGVDFSGADGVARIALAAPADYGPASIQVRARWARSQPVVVPAFQDAPAQGLSVNLACAGDPEDTLEVATESWQTLRLADGRFALVGLARDDTRAHLFVAAWNGTGTADACSAALGDISTFAILRATAADPVDRILVMTQQEWIEHEIVPQGGAIALVERRRTDWNTSPPANPPGAIVTVRDCDANDPAADYVLAQFGDGSVVPLRDAVITPQPFAGALNLHLDELNPALPPRISQSGCIALDEDGTALPALILQAPRGPDAEIVPRFLIADDPDQHFAGLIVPSFGAVAFTPIAIGEPLLLGGTFDPAGARVVRWRLIPGDAGLELREVFADDAAGPPASIALGDLDGDQFIDTVWGLVDAVPGGVEEARLQISLGCRAGTVALNSLSRPVASAAAAVFLAPEPDGTADLAIGGSRLVLFVDPDAR